MIWNLLECSSTQKDSCPFTLKGACFELIELEDDTNLIWSFQKEAWLRWPWTFWKYRLIPCPPTMTDTPIPTSSSSWLSPSPWTAHEGPAEDVWGQPRWFSSVHPHLLYHSVVHWGHCQGPAQTAARWLRSIWTRTSWLVSTIKLWLILPCTVPLVQSLIHAVIILLLTYLHHLSRALLAH